METQNDGLMFKGKQISLHEFWKSVDAIQFYKQFNFSFHFKHTDFIIHNRYYNKMNCNRFCPLVYFILFLVS